MSAPGPFGDPDRHLPFETLERGLLSLAPPGDAGTVALVVARGEDGERRTPARAMLTVEDGVPGDAWSRTPHQSPEVQITLMQADVARLLANGQPLSLFGDNLLVELDLSAPNLPAGTRLRAGGAILEVTAKPHAGCAKFLQRVGADALRLTADERFRHLRLRGIHARVIAAGEVGPGDEIRVLRPDP